MTAMQTLVERTTLGARDIETGTWEWASRAAGAARVARAQELAELVEVVEVALVESGARASLASS